MASIILITRSLVRWLVLAGVVFFLHSFSASAQHTQKENTLKCDSSELTKLVEQLAPGSLVGYKRYQAIFCLHSLGKEAIPVLIENISREEPTYVSLVNPLTSDRRGATRNMFLGEVAAYIVELILARANLTVDRISDFKHWELGSYKNYIYGIGLIVNAHTKKAIGSEELGEIQRIYAEWWNKNKEKSIDELRLWWKGNSILGEKYWK